MYWKYFKSSTLFLVVALLFSFFVGFYYTGHWSGAFQSLFIALVLAVLEISLSFDNAIVNAKILATMDSVWRHRFLTWGMIIAVFGMRLVFPVAIVSFAAWINPLAAIKMALWEPNVYAQKMLENHYLVAAFGGSFLLLVALDFFYDQNKDEHWIQSIEKRLALLGQIRALEIFIALLMILILSVLLEERFRLGFLQAGVAGILCYISVRALSQILNFSEDQNKVIQKAGAASFIYLEVLDASFSFDGVVGAFAVTTNLLVIISGLSIGAFFVRSLTILFVEKTLLTQFKYLEHGAFYAIGLLAVLMLLDPFFHFPEWVTGLSGAVIIAGSYFSSVKEIRSESSRSQK